MASASEARVELQKGLRLFKAFEQADKAVAVLEGLEQNERELNAKVARLKDEATAAEEASAQRMKEIERRETEARKAAEAAEKGAKTAGKAEIEKAERRAEEILAAAQKKVADLQAKERGLQKSLADLDKEIAAKTREAKTVEDRLERAREARDAMLRG
jgi:colicin import membrane protein